MKIALAAVAALFFATAARADSTVVVDVTASTCTYCFSLTQPDTDVINLEAQFTLEQVTGSFFNSGEQDLFSATEWEVTAITGSLNGYPMELVPGFQGSASWLNQDKFYNLGSVYFMADGVFSWLENDNTYDLLNQDGQPFVPITWDVVAAPAKTSEPSALLLAAMGLAALVGLRWRETRKGRNCHVGN